MSYKSVEPPEGGDGRFGTGDSDGFDFTLVVPDDARELDRDLEAWKREQRWRRRKQFFERLVFTSGRREGGISGLFIAAVLVAVAMVGATASMLAMRGTKAPPAIAPLELASPVAPPGTPGGLLPTAVLSTASGTISSRELRPAVVALVSPGCDCSKAVAALTREAAVSNVPVDLVGATGQAEQLGQLVSATSLGRARAFIDSKGDLIAAYAPTGLTVVPVYADGVTESAVRNYTAQTSLGATLAELKHAGPVSSMSRAR